MPLSTTLTTALRTLRTEEARIQRELESLRGQIQALSGVTGSHGAGKRGPGRPPGSGGTQRKMSAAGRAAISRATRKRWAAWRKGKAAK